MAMTSPLRFTKGHGTENDFVVLDDPDGELDLDAAAVVALTDRRAGIGADGVIRAVRTARARIDAPADDPEWFMDYRNGDGSQAEMCGNGVRVLAAHLRRVGHVHEDTFVVWTRAGARTVEIRSAPSGTELSWRVRVGMGAAHLQESGREVTVAGRRLPVVDVDMGNPHAVAFLPEQLSLEDLDLTGRPPLDPEPADGANSERVAPRGERHVAMRVVGRGVAETRACGTGVGAAAMAAARRAHDGSGLPWPVDVPGGRLSVGWTDTGEVTLTGPAALVADGVMLR